MGNTCARIQQPPSKHPNSHILKPQPTLTTRKNSLVSQSTFVRLKDCNIYSDYTFIYPAVGKGAFGDVYKVIQKKTGLVRAVKQIIGRSSEDTYVEFEALKRLDHPNIVKIFEIYVDTLDIFLVTELCSGGELFDHIVEEGRLSESIAANYMWQILSAVAYFHANKVVHRDLKPSNIMFSRKGDNSVIKIIDFGASELLNKKEKKNSAIGTAYYIAPEVLQGNSGSKCDLWSCGVILYIMLSGEPPFVGRSDDEVLNKVRAGKFEYSGRIWSLISPEAKNFINRLLEKDPTKRLSATEALNAEWITNRKRKNAIGEEQFVVAIRNIHNFCKMSQFQECIMTFIANFMATTEEKQRLIEQFRAFDSDGDGKISRQELITAYSRLQGSSHLKKEDIEQIFRAIDSNMSGYIDFTEFIAASIQKNRIVTRKHLQYTFNLIDKDKNSCLSLKQLSVFLGGAISQQVYTQILKECNTTQSEEVTKLLKQITKDGFMKLMIRVAESGVANLTI